MAYLLTGSNMGDRAENLGSALLRIGDVAGDIIRVSRIYESPPWGFSDPVSFLNQAIMLQTHHGPAALLGKLLLIEKELGRTRVSGNYESRIIDIDILLFDDIILESDELTVPHPRMHLRKFALEPLAEIAPSLFHPLLMKNMVDLLQECTDRSKSSVYRAGEQILSGREVDNAL